MWFDVMMIVCGAFFLINTVYMKASGKIPSALINPRIKLERSHDIPGFIKFIFPRGLICSSLVIAGSVIMMLDAGGTCSVNPWLYILSELAIIVSWIFFGISSVKAQNKYLF